MFNARRLLVLASASAALLAAPTVGHAAIVTNGDFETGNLSGWTQSDLPDSGAGTWFVYSGTGNPGSGNPLAPPPQGNFAAVVDQSGPGLRILYQDVTLPPNVTAYQLHMFAYYHVYANIASPDTFDFAGPDANEQYRVDVMRPAAPVDSLAAGDILATVFRTQTGDPTELPPTIKTADLSALAGQSVRIRLAEVDNQDVFNASADAISIAGLTFGKTTLNKKKGTARLSVTATDPGTLTLTGKGVKPRSAPASKSVAVKGGPVSLVVKPKGKTRRKLNDNGKAKVKVTVTYTPAGGAPISEKKKIKLKKKG
jgi:hypothetical protein